MKIKVRIREVAKSRGITTAYQLQKLANLAPANAAKLYRNDIGRVSMQTLATLCEVLHCTPNDLFVLPSQIRSPSKR